MSFAASSSSINGLPPASPLLLTPPQEAGQPVVSSRSPGELILGTPSRGVSRFVQAEEGADYSLFFPHIFGSPSVQQAVSNSSEPEDQTYLQFFAESPLGGRRQPPNQGDNPLENSPSWTERRVTVVNPGPGSMTLVSHNQVLILTPPRPSKEQGSSQTRSSLKHPRGGIEELENPVRKKNRLLGKNLFQGSDEPESPVSRGEPKISNMEAELRLLREEFELVRNGAEIAQREAKAAKTLASTLKLQNRQLSFQLPGKDDLNTLKERVLVLENENQKLASHNQQLSSRLAEFVCTDIGSKLLEVTNERTWLRNQLAEADQKYRQRFDQHSNELIVGLQSRYGEILQEKDFLLQQLKNEVEELKLENRRLLIGASGSVGLPSPFGPFSQNQAAAPLTAMELSSQNLLSSADPYREAQTEAVLGEDLLSVAPLSAPVVLGSSLEHQYPPLVVPTKDLVEAFRKEISNLLKNCVRQDLKNKINSFHNKIKSALDLGLPLPKQEAEGLISEFEQIRREVMEGGSRTNSSSAPVIILD